MCVTDKVVNVENFTNLDESGDPKSGSGISYKWKMLFTIEMFSYFCFIVKKYLITNDVSHALSLLSLFKLLNLLEDRSNRIPTIYLKDVLFKNHKQKQILYRRVLWLLLCFSLLSFPWLYWSDH